ncbi:neprilysin-2-like [Dermacentor variabilis]|uniref:neprilysin-2-like n=1 Tax=Dermacentor variabilis TaxID=34621 RepID=UPI003F5AED0A
MAPSTAACHEAMNEGGRRRVLKSALATLPTCAACSVIGVVLLTLGATVFTKKYLLPAYAQFRARAASTTETSWSFPHWTRKRIDPRLCRSTACQWTAQNVLDNAVWSRNPCDDFYAHVCAKEHSSFDAIAQPPTPLSTAVRLFGDLELLFRRYPEAKKEASNGIEVGPGDNFFSQMIWVYDECRKEAVNSDRLVSLELDAILDELGLVSWTPQTRPLTHVVARADRLLRLHPLFTVAVKPSRTFPSREGDGFFLAVGPPETLYRRYMLKQHEDSEKRYLQLVDVALCAWNTSQTCGLAAEPLTRIATTEEKPDSNISGVTDEPLARNYSTGAQIVALEKELDAATLLPGEPHDTSPRYKAVAIKDLPASEAWNWATYFRTLLAGSNEPVDDDAFISVSDAVSIQDLWQVISSSLDYVVVNYVTFKVLVELSPFLGKAGEDILTLTHDLEGRGLKQRQAACIATLEKLYKYGVAIAAKLTAGREYATVQRSYLDRQMRQQFKKTKRMVKALLAANRSWIGDADAVKVATHKLNAMSFEFGARDNLVEYEHYRKARASWPPLRQNGTSILTSVFGIHVHASSLYWDAFGSDSPAYDNQFSVSSLWPSHEFQRSRNSLFLPHAAVSLLNGVSNAIHPVFYPVVAPHVVRGVIRAVTLDEPSGAVKDDDVGQQWRISAEASRLKDVEDCLAVHYASAPSVDGVSNLTELDFLDNAMIYPLYSMYRDAISREKLSRFFVKGPFGLVDEAQVFFYNLAAAMCDFTNATDWDRRRSYRVTPARWRVNVPLRNSRFFAEAFRCAPDTYMNPTIECNVWRTPHSRFISRKLHAVKPK